jgi:thiamine-phosphate pyrophosphorylase
MTFDLSVYAVADVAHTRGRPLADLVEAAVAGGATLVQLRDKTSETRAMVATARALAGVLRGTGVPLIVNDRVDVALAAGADGVHLGQDDMDIADARRLLGPRAILGVTVRTEREARATPLAAADYAAVGGVFATSSKANETPPVGLDGLSALAAILRARRPGLPICAIAGITAANAAGVIAAGADGLAVVSTIFMADDPAAAARALAGAVAEGKARKAA